LEPGEEGGTMNATLKRVSGGTALALSAGISAEMLGHRAFTHLVGRDLQALLAHPAVDTSRLVTEEMLHDLPEPVQRYLTYAGVVGKPMVRTVHLRQRGRMRPSPGQPWMALDAEQWYSVRPPGFVWAGTVHVGPVPVGRARDMYRDGRGHMLVKVASLIPVVDAVGEETDQAAMMRYLSEMVWFPAAFLEDNVSFEAVDDRSVRVTLTDQGRTATATLFFDSEGRLTDFVAKRYRGEKWGLGTWSTPITGYGEFEGLRLPVQGKALWKLPEGDLEYFNVTVTEIRYGVQPGTAERSNDGVSSATQGRTSRTTSGGTRRTPPSELPG
jgi:hypothetical protein